MQPHYCFPVIIKSGDIDFAWHFLCMVHLATLLLILYTCSIPVFCIMAIAVLISLRYFWCCQSATRNALALNGVNLDQWSLESRAGGCSFVEVRHLQFAGPL